MRHTNPKRERGPLDRIESWTGAMIPGLSQRKRWLAHAASESAAAEAATKATVAPADCRSAAIAFESPGLAAPKGRPAEANASDRITDAANRNTGGAHIGLLGDDLCRTFIRRESVVARDSCVVGRGTVGGRTVRCASAGNNSNRAVGSVRVVGAGRSISGSVRVIFARGSVRSVGVIAARLAVVAAFVAAAVVIAVVAALAAAAVTA